MSVANTRIRPSSPKDFGAILDVINESALAYKGVIPKELYREPFITRNYLSSEITNGVEFNLFEQDGRVLGVMGTQHKGEVVLIRHSYVVSCYRRRGVGSSLLESHMKSCEAPMLVGCLRAMTWAISFYEKHGFVLLSDAQRDLLRAKHWSLPKEHVRQSVVLGDQKWCSKCS